MLSSLEVATLTYTPHHTMLSTQNSNLTLINISMQQSMQTMQLKSNTLAGDRGNIQIMTKKTRVVLVCPDSVPAPGPAPDITVLFHSHRSPVTAGEAVKLDSANQCQLELTRAFVVLISAITYPVSYRHS